MADGSACPAEDLVECSGHNDYRGWWSTHFDATLIFYDPADLARVLEALSERDLTVDYRALFDKFSETRTRRSLRVLLQRLAAARR